MRLTLLILLSFILAIQSSKGESKEIDRILKSAALQSASYCIYAIDAKSGETIYATEQKSLSTASVMKVFTTGVALNQLGRDFTFSTSLWYSGKLDPANGVLSGDLIMKGGCDPAFYSSYFSDHYQNCFETWIEELKRLGIRKIKGNLLLDLTAMPDANLPGGWCWDDIGNYYGAGVSPLTFNDNCYEIHFSSAPSEGVLTKIISINPDIQGLKPDNQVKSSLRSGDHTIVYTAPGTLSPRIEGTIPVGQADFVIKAALPDPALTAGTIFLKMIRDNGVVLDGTVSKQFHGNVSESVFVAEKKSPPLKDLIVPLNKESLNLYAEHLLCEIGRRHSGSPTMESGLEAYSQFCKLHQIDATGFYPNDGSGLSRSNALTAKTLVEMIHFIGQSKDSSSFFHALPIAGVDGTLKNAFKNSPLENNVIAKTGSMARVRSLAGKMTTKSKKTLLFTILINNANLTSAEMASLLESILMALYEDHPIAAK